MFLFINITIILSYAIFSFFINDLNFLLKEDHLIESIAVISLLMSWGHVTRYVIRHRQELSKVFKVILLGYAFFMLVAAGEEASWGQRIIGLETPELIAKHNMQNEFNLHNLEIFNRRDRDGDKKGIALLLSAEMLYNLIAIGLFLFLPLIKKFMGPFKPLIPPKKFILPLVLTFVLMKVSLMIFGNIQTPLMTLQRGLGELKETILSCLFAIYGYYLVRNPSLLAPRDFRKRLDM